MDLPSAFARFDLLDDIMSEIGVDETDLEAQIAALAANTSKGVPQATGAMTDYILTATISPKDATSRIWSCWPTSRNGTCR